MRALFFVFFLLPLISSCAEAEPPKLHYEIVNSYEHSTSLFTQGLLFYQGKLYESTGQYGQSQLLRYADDFSGPRIRRSLESRYFGEGIAVLNDQVFMLTWQSELALIYDPAGFSVLGSFTYVGEGWGLTSDGQDLWMSNGSATLTRRNEEGAVLEEVQVSLDGQALDRLNELEYVNGLIFANRWYDDQIYVIQPTSGGVIATMDFSALAAQQLGGNPGNVLNGIAWNPERETLWITGKNWSEIYELRVDFPEH